MICFVVGVIAILIGINWFTAVFSEMDVCKTDPCYPHRSFCCEPKTSRCWRNSMYGHDIIVDVPYGYNECIQNQWLQYCCNPIFNSCVQHNFSIITF